MKIDYNKKIKGLCYVEDVLDNDGKRVTKILFNNDCRLINDANEYLRELRITSLSSYNSINIVARDLCHFYNFLQISCKKIKEINSEWLSAFVDYLTKIEVNRKSYSIENSMLTRLDLNISCLNKNVASIRKASTLANTSIYRIFNRTINYLAYLYEKGEKVDQRLLKNLGDNKSRIRFIRANGIGINSDNIYYSISEQVITDKQIERIKEESSKKNDYERFLYFVLEKTGMRIGETLGLKIIESDPNNIRSIKGDIYYENDIWKIKIVYRNDNPHDSLSKSHRLRTVGIKDSDKFEFELLLERYMKYRKRKLSSGNIDWLFISNRGTKLSQNTVYKRFKNTLEKACPESADKITLHSFRHTFCTKELLAGTPIEFVAKIVGHSNPQTTYMIYVHYSGEEMRKIREKYSHYMRENLKGELKWNI